METASVNSRTFSQGSNKLTSQALASVQMSENEVFKMCIRNSDKATLGQIAS